MKKYKADIEKIQNLLPKDREIIALYEEIIKEMDLQLENGVITSTDYVNQLNEQLQAKLQLKLHEVQIEQKRVNICSIRDFFNQN
jgi:outer membrane protein TolC